MARAPARDVVPAPLGEQYYLDNLEHVVRHALERYDDVLAASETQILRGFLGLGPGARRLYARLYLRKGPVFRRSLLRYSEIDDIDQAAADLVTAGLLAFRRAAEEGDSRAAILATFTAEELKTAARECGLGKAALRADVVTLVEGHPDGLAWMDCRDIFLERLVAGVFDLAQLLFFGNLGQDLSEFVLVGLERARYAEYDLCHEVRLFETRAGLLAFLEATAFAAEEVDVSDADGLRIRAARALEALACCEPVRPHAWRVHPGRSYARAAFACARELERLGGLEDAVELYAVLARLAPRVGLRADAADRLGLAAARCGRAVRFDEVCAGLLEDAALDAIARFAIESRAAIVSGSPTPRRRLQAPEVISLELEGAGHAGSKALYRDLEGRAVTIEDATLELLGGGLHAENTLYRALFGLLLWDVIFAPIPGMFQHRFQASPLDVSSEHFFTNRRALVERRLTDLVAADRAREVLDAHSRHAGQMNGFVSWDAYAPIDLARATEALGEKLLPLLERLARHPKRHGRGLPDLLVLAPDGPVLVEVKGPGDQPHVEQRLWHDALIGMGLRVQIARVKRRDALAP